MLESDHHARQQALEVHRSFIVQAPAGSGKTALLTMRFLSLLAHVEREPEECLAITFTRKAASEMRERILDSLELGLGPEPRDSFDLSIWRLAQAVLRRDKALDWRLLDNPSRLKIQTVDALSASLAARMPLLSRLGANPQVVESAHALYELAAKNLLADLEREGSLQADLKVLVAHLDNNLDMSAKLLAQLLAQREQWLSRVIDVDMNALKVELEEALQTLVLETLDLAVALIKPELRSELCALLSWAAEHSEVDALSGFRELQADPLTVDVQALSLWQGCAKLLLTQDNTWRKSVNQTQGFPPKSQGRDALEQTFFAEQKQKMLQILAQLDATPGLVELFVKIKLLPEPHFSAQQWAFVSSMMRLLPMLAAHLKLVFQEKAQVDFAEIALSAHYALTDSRGPSDLALALDYKIRHILVDEYQDTSLAQARLLRLLMQGWQAGEGRTLFLVGDPMQSIYRFRQAEVGLFLATQAQGFIEVELESLTLNQNFRSDACVLDWLQAIFAQAFPSFDDISAGAIKFTPSQALVHNTPSACAQFHLASGDDDRLEAREIAELILQERQREPEGTCAILVRNRSHLKHIFPALRALDIPYQGIDIEPLGERPLIQDLMSLSIALTDLSCRTSWFAILRAPWCALALSDLLIIAQAANTQTLMPTLLEFEQLDLSPIGHRQLQRVVPILRDALDQRARLALRVWLQKTWASLGGECCLEGPTALLEVDVFFDLLEDCMQTPRAFDRKALERELKRLYAPNIERLNNPVQIMTIHKAKGLEFDWVVMPGLGRKANIDDEQLLLWANKPSLRGDDYWLMAPIKAVGDEMDSIYRFLNREQQLANEHEALRLLYVGATRARKQLHWWAQLKDHAKPAKHSLLSYVWPYLEPNSKLPSLSLLPTPETKPPIKAQPKFYRRLFSETDLSKPVPVRIKSDKNASEIKVASKPDKRTASKVLAQSLLKFKGDGTRSFEQALVQLEKTVIETSTPPLLHTWSVIRKNMLQDNGLKRILSSRDITGPHRYCYLRQGALDELDVDWRVAQGRDAWLIVLQLCDELNLPSEVSDMLSKLRALQLALSRGEHVYKVALYLPQYQQWHGDPL